MGLIGDILYLPIRLIKLPFKFWLLPFRIPGRILYGSKKDQLERERAQQKESMVKEKEEVQKDAAKPVPFYVSGNPDDMKTVCGTVDMSIASDKIKRICAQGGGSKKKKRSKGRGKTRKGK